MHVACGPSLQLRKQRLRKRGGIPVSATHASPISAHPSAHWMLVDEHGHQMLRAGAQSYMLSGYTFANQAMFLCAKKRDEGSTMGEWLLSRADDPAGTQAPHLPVTTPRNASISQGWPDLQLPHLPPGAEHEASTGTVGPRLGLGVRQKDGQSLGPLRGTEPRQGGGGETRARDPPGPCARRCPPTRPFPSSCWQSPFHWTLLPVVHAQPPAPGIPQVPNQ